jgi:hypothetical protein
MPRRGRKTDADWDYLYREWRALPSDVSAESYLKTKLTDRGMQAPGTRKRIEGWERLRAGKPEIKEEISPAVLVKHIDEPAHPSIKFATVQQLRVLMNGLRDELLQYVTPSSSEGISPILLWQRYVEWRREQGVKDYFLGEKLRQHLNLQLSKTLVVREVKLADGSVEERIESTLNPKELAQYTDTAAKIQTIQRLALGMSTENIGVDMPGASEQTAAREGAAEDGLPVFVVEMSRGGKFQRITPRQTNKETVVEAKA